MNEVSYATALAAGIEPIHYRADYLESLAAGSYPARLDALVWARRTPCLMALLSLEMGVKIQIVGFQRHSRKDLPEYLGFRAFTAGQSVVLVIDRGPRGGMRPSLVVPQKPQIVFDGTTVSLTWISTPVVPSSKEPAADARGGAMSAACEPGVSNGAPRMTPQERRRREDAVRFANASVGLEGFVVTAEDHARADRFVAGQIDLAEFLRRGR